MCKLPYKPYLHPMKYMFQLHKNKLSQIKNCLHFGPETLDYALKYPNNTGSNNKFRHYHSYP